MLFSLWEKLEGKKTFAVVIPIFIHQILKGFGVDFASQEVSMMADGVLAMLAIVFRAIAKPRGVE